MSFIQKILIAIDSSSCAIHAAKKGLALTKQLNATAALIYVIDKNKETISADLAITPEQSETVLLKQAQETLDQITKMYGEGLELLHFTPEGIPKEEILTTAWEWKADLIVMGTHGLGGLVHALMGSVTEYVIKHYEKPVMVVREKKGL